MDDAEKRAPPAENGSITLAVSVGCAVAVLCALLAMVAAFAVLRYCPLPPE